MLSGPATRINTAALDLEFAERRVAASANKLLRQVTRNQFSGFKNAATMQSAPNQNGFKVKSPTRLYHFRSLIG